MSQSDAILDRFSRKCERRTKKAERRFERYEKKIQNVKGYAPDEVKKPEAGSGKEPLLDSLRLIYGFAEFAGIENQKSKIDNAQKQLNTSQRTKNELQQRKEHWKAQAKEHPKSEKWLRKMEKERYYYNAQINEYRKTLRDPSNLDEKLMIALRNDPRFSDFAATLPANPQNNPAKMQPRQLVQQMMQTQAAAISADPAALIREAQQQGAELLGKLSAQSSSFGNIDNAAQMPAFTPNPYKTKSFWERIDVGGNLQFDNRTQFMPATGIAGAQASFNFDPKFSVGVLANYRFGMGEIKSIHFSHIGAGYGAFANYKVWKALGVQAGYERNWRAETEINEIQYPAAWSNSALAGLTWEYSVGKKAKGTVGVFYDAMHKRSTPKGNAVVWRMGWKM